MEKNIPLSEIYMDEDQIKAVIDVLESGWFILGEKVREFEEKFSKEIGTKFSISVSSGTSALFLSLLASDIKKGDEVIVPSFSFIATATPIIHAGATPVFVDIDKTSYNIDPSEIESKITNRTKAIMPVHLYGNPAKMDEIKNIASTHDLIVIEDACQAHGALYNGKKIGSIGDVGCFSFYPSKIMTVCGDGGMVVTDNEEIAEKIRLLRDHGRKDKYLHEVIGYNMRSNEIQAALGIKQLEKLPTWITARRKIASKYNDLLNDHVITPVEYKNALHVYYMYVIRAKKRDALQKHLKDLNISTGIHYPVPIHKQPAIINYMGDNVKLKNTEECAKTVLSLPMHPKLSNDDIEYICEKINNFI